MLTTTTTDPHAILDGLIARFPTPWAAIVHLAQDLASDAQETAATREEWLRLHDEMRELVEWAARESAAA